MRVILTTYLTCSYERHADAERQNGGQLGQSRIHFRPEQPNNTVLHNPSGVRQYYKYSLAPSTVLRRESTIALDSR
jgi:hypothetical protein